VTGDRPHRRGAAARRARGDDGSAVAEFALVSVVLVPVFFAVLQLAFVWHVRTTLTSAASQGARYAAAYDRGVDDGERRTSEVIDEALGDAVDDRVSGSEQTIGGQREVEMTVRAEVPTLAFWGPSITVEVSGHAVEEILP
jgi:Flp pilus assembly protein TadG